MSDVRPASYAISASPYDIWGEGADTVARNCADIGLGGISLATVYHSGRDVFPHNPSGRVRFLDADASFFENDPSLYGRIRPRVSSDVKRMGDPLRLAREATRQSDLTLSAWLVICHNEELARAHPGSSLRSAFGDPYVTSLCPSAPEVHEYAAALARDVSRYEPDGLVVEATYFPGFDHGYHHERSFAVQSSIAQELLGCCFCENCARYATRAGLNLNSLAVHVAAWLDRSMNRLDQTSPETEAWWAEYEEFVGARSVAVSELSAHLREGAGSTRIMFVDDSAALNSASSTSAVPAASRRSGIDIAALVSSVDAVVVPVGEADDLSALKTTVEAYAGFVAPLELVVSLRPAPPTCITSDDIRSRIEASLASGATAMSFYHYGFLPRATLEILGRALQGT